LNTNWSFPPPAPTGKARYRKSNRHRGAGRRVSEWVSSPPQNSLCFAVRLKHFFSFSPCPQLAKPRRGTTEKKCLTRAPRRLFGGCRGNTFFRRVSAEIDHGAHERPLCLIAHALPGCRREAGAGRQAIGKKNSFPAVASASRRQTTPLPVGFRPARIPMPNPHRTIQGGQRRALRPRRRGFVSVGVGLPNDVGVGPSGRTGVDRSAAPCTVGSLRNSRRKKRAWGIAAGEKMTVSVGTWSDYGVSNSVASSHDQTMFGSLVGVEIGDDECGPRL
jgi:hypothetical protein